VVANTTLDRAYGPELWRLKGEVLLAIERSRTTRGRVRGHGSSIADHDEPERCLLRALELSRAAGARSLELRAATSVARVWASRRRIVEAGELLGDVCRWFGTRTETADLAEARALLAALAEGSPQSLIEPDRAG
jgi:adenylate cyclase